MAKYRWINGKVINNTGARKQGDVTNHIYTINGNLAGGARNVSMC